MKRLLNNLTWSFAVFWLAFAVIAMVSVIAGGRSPNGPELFGYRFMMVLSDSMTPAIRAGDMVVGRPAVPEQIDAGQIITYRNNISRKLITHRVVEVTQVGSERAFVTQGDSNNTSDANPILPRDIVAVYGFRVPYMGYLLAFAQHWTGLIALVVAPSLILMVSEARRIVRLLKFQEQHPQPQ